MKYTVALLGLVLLCLLAAPASGERLDRGLSEKEVQSALTYLKESILKPGERISDVYHVQSEKYVIAHGVKYYFTLAVENEKGEVKYLIEVWQDSSGRYSMDKMPRRIESIEPGTTKSKRTRVGVVSSNFRHTLPAFAALSTELASRGYEVTLYTPQYSPDIQVQGNVERVVYTGEQSPTHMFDFCAGFAACDYVRVFHNTSNHRAAFLSLKYKLNSHDFLVIDRFSYAALDLADYYNMSHVIYSPTPIYGLESAPLHVPAPLSGSRKAMDSLSRFHSLFVHLGTFITSALTCLSSNRARYESGLSYRVLSDYHRNTTAIVGTEFGFEYPQPLSPSISVLGPQVPPSSSRLREDIENFLDLALARKQPVVLVRFSNAAPLTVKHIREVTLALQGNLTLWVLPDHLSSPYHVINLPNSEVRRNLDANSTIYALKHGAIKAAFSDCDATLVQESLLYGVPTTCIDLLPEQRDIGARLMDLEAGQHIEGGISKFTHGLIGLRTRALWKYPQFARGAARARQILSEGRGLKGAADVIESAMLSDVSTRVISYYPSLPTYRQWYLDLLLMLVVVYTFVYSLVSYFSDMLRVRAQNRADPTSRNLVPETVMPTRIPNFQAKPKEE